MDNNKLNKYKQNYNKENYKEIRFWFPKDRITSATEYAKAHGYETLNAYAKALLEDALATDFATSSQQS